MADRDIEQVADRAVAPTLTLHRRTPTGRWHTRPVVGHPPISPDLAWLLRRRGVFHPQTMLPTVVALYQLQLSDDADELARLVRWCDKHAWAGGLAWEITP